MIPSKTFIYFLLDTPTGKAWYKDGAGFLKNVIVGSTTDDVTLKNAPGNWMETELSFIRNSIYHGFNRAYSTAQEFVRDAKSIIEELTLNGLLTEVPLTLAVYKLNRNPQDGDPNYELYIKAQVDILNIEGIVLQSITANLMEAGAAQLLKAYEDTPLQIPCDGSIVENVKINLDGLRVEDTFFYQISNIKQVDGVAHWIPAVFINNEGDNYGIIKGSPSFISVGTDAQNAVDGSFLIQSTQPVRVRLKGNITVTNNNAGIINKFRLFYRNQNATTTGQVTAQTLIPFTTITQATNFTFERTIDLQAYEKLFLVVQIDRSDGTLLNEIIGGAFSLEFASQYQSTRAWGIRVNDLWRLIVKEICRLASVAGQPFNYSAVSNLLDEYSHLIYTSGDALRASGDPNYQRYFSISENSQTSFGPQIKISLKQFYQDLSVPLCAAIGVRNIDGGEAFFFERMRDVYNQDSAPFDLGEVSQLRYQIARDLMFSDLEIGYEPKEYDQKAGKYEYNTTAKYKAPISSFNKKLQIISKTRTDSYGIERIRSNQGGTSTTRNSGDNDLFLINCNPDSFIYDNFTARFTSLLQDPANTSNTNIRYVVAADQKVNLPISQGDYFSPMSDNGIFVFSVPGYAATENCNIAIDGILNSVNKLPGTPDDQIDFEIVHNGAVIQAFTQMVTGVDTPISFSINFTEPFAYHDALYIIMKTSPTAEANINTATLSIGAYVNMNGVNIPVMGGVYEQLLSMPNITPSGNPYVNGSSRVQYGFQYFMFNSTVPNTEFNLNVGVNGFTHGSVLPFTISVYINGELQPDNITVPGTVAYAPFTRELATITRNFQLGDIIFFTVTVQSGADVQFSTFDLRLFSTYIKAYALKRVQYDSLQGIPNIVTDASGNIRTDIAGAPYNIEDLTPARCLLAWLDYLKSLFPDQVTGMLKFQSLSKNSYLATSYNGQAIIERSDVDLMAATRMFYPMYALANTHVQQTFAKILGQAINAYISFTFLGRSFGSFPMEMRQRPALNESQDWRMLIAANTPLSTFADITSFKMPEMPSTSIFISVSHPVQFVPYNRVFNAKYHTPNRDASLFAEQIARWSQKDGYCQPWQIGDPISMQFITRDIDPIFFTVYKKGGDLYTGPQNLNTIFSPAVSNFNIANPTQTRVLWQYNIDTSTWDADCYYIVISSTTVGNLLISECQHLDADQPDTSVIEPFSSFNTQGLLFDGTTPYKPMMRFLGSFDNRFKQKYAGKFYTDQRQSQSILGAEAFEVSELIVVNVPDYITKKVSRMLLMDSTRLEGEGFTLNDGAEWNETFTKGAPKKIQAIEIRPTINRDGISVTGGVFDLDNSLIVSVNPQSFGPNITNASGTTDTDLIEINVTE